MRPLASLVATRQANDRMLLSILSHELSITGKIVVKILPTRYRYTGKGKGGQFLGRPIGGGASCVAWCVSCVCSRGSLIIINKNIMSLHSYIIQHSSYTFLFCIHVSHINAAGDTRLWPRCDGHSVRSRLPRTAVRGGGTSGAHCHWGSNLTRRDRLFWLPRFIIYLIKTEMWNSTVAIHFKRRMW